MTCKWLSSCHQDLCFRGLAASIRLRFVSTGLLGMPWKMSCGVSLGQALGMCCEIVFVVDCICARCCELHVLLAGLFLAKLKGCATC